MTDAGLISYTDGSEDILLWNAFSDVPVGYYIDIGAADPEHNSITKLFYTKGWSGLNVAVPGRRLQRLCSKRRRDRNIALPVDPVSCGAPKTFGVFLSESLPSDCDVHFLRIDDSVMLTCRDTICERISPWIIVVSSSDFADGEADTTDLHEAYEHVYFDGVQNIYLKKGVRIDRNLFRRRPHPKRENFVPWSSHASRGSGLRDTFLSATVGHEYRMIERANGRIEALEDLWVRRPRPLWDRVMFSSSGRIKALFRVLFFKKDGSPREHFLNWIVLPDGRPRTVFFSWLSSKKYMRLEQALKLPAEYQRIKPQNNRLSMRPMGEPSRRAKEIQDMLSSHGRQEGPLVR